MGKVTSLPRSKRPLKHATAAPQRRGRQDRQRGAALSVIPVLLGAALLGGISGMMLGPDAPVVGAAPLALTGTPVAPHRFARCGSGPRVTCVVDGDTIWLEGEKIRLADFDTPEISEPRCAAEKALGERATERLIVLLNSGPVSLAPNPEGHASDRYGRSLQIALVNGQSVGDKLVAEGLAHRWDGRRHPWC